MDKADKLHILLATTACSLFLMGNLFFVKRLVDNVDGLAVKLDAQKEVTWQAIQRLTVLETTISNQNTWRKK